MGINTTDNIGRRVSEIQALTCLTDEQAVVLAVSENGRDPVDHLETLEEYGIAKEEISGILSSLEGRKRQIEQEYAVVNNGVRGPMSFIGEQFNSPVGDLDDADLEEQLRVYTACKHFKLEKICYRNTTVVIEDRLEDLTDELRNRITDGDKATADNPVECWDVEWKRSGEIWQAEDGQFNLSFGGETPQTVGIDDLVERLTEGEVEISL